jgi:hypothetical protein
VAAGSEGMTERPDDAAAEPAIGPVTLQLDPERIIATVDVLHRRIEERFPGSGLGRVAAHLEEVARVTVERIAWVGRAHIPLRIGIALVIVLTLLVLGRLLLIVDWTSISGDLAEAIQTVEAAINELFLIGAALFFLVTVEGRIKRRRALRFLRELRAMAHLVDMHQLTKDPEHAAHGRPTTPSSPRLDLTPFELGRYLDYCSEMLSLISKIAALYAQKSDDAVVLAAVDEVETLTSGLSAKIWQKIIILDRVTDETGRLMP